jgi:four helix bundle protein
VNKRAATSQMLCGLPVFFLSQFGCKMKSGNPYASSYQDLLVYQKARKLASEIFQISRSFPREEMYALTDQMRRSSRSIGAQIAEAWGKRGYPKHFISELSDANSEQYETQHWIDVALDCGYLDPAVAAELSERCRETGRLLYGIAQKADQFCQKPPGIADEAAPYLFGVDPEDSILLDESE